jgi:hypothetical protein
VADGTEIAARAVVIAIGVSWRRLEVPTLEALLGAGVLYGAAGSEVKAMSGQDVYVVGAGNSAGQSASWSWSPRRPQRDLLRWGAGPTAASGGRAWPPARPGRPGRALPCP